MSSNSSSDWNVRVRLLSARRCARMRVMSRPPNVTEPPVIGAKPVTASMSVVLPGAVGPDEPGDAPRTAPATTRHRRPEGRRRQRTSPFELERGAPRSRARLPPSTEWARRGSASETRRASTGAMSATALMRAKPALEAVGEAVGMEDRRRDQPEAADQVGVPADAEPLVEQASGRIRSAANNRPATTAPEMRATPPM